MSKKKNVFIKILAKIIYGLVGTSAIYSILRFLRLFFNAPGMTWLDYVAVTLLIIGGLNWLVKISGKDLFELIGNY